MARGCTEESPHAAAQPRALLIRRAACDQSTKSTLRQAPSPGLLVLPMMEAIHGWLLACCQLGTCSSSSSPAVPDCLANWLTAAVPVPVTHNHRQPLQSLHLQLPPCAESRPSFQAPSSTTPAKLLVRRAPESHPGIPQPIWPVARTSLSASTAVLARCLYCSLTTSFSSITTTTTLALPPLRSPSPSSRPLAIPLSVSPPRPGPLELPRRVSTSMLLA